MENTFDFDFVRRALRREIDRSQIAPTTLSLKVGKSKSLVKDILDDGKDIKLSTLYKLAAALDVDVSALIPTHASNANVPVLNADTLEPLIDALLPLAPPPGQMTDQSRRAVAEALAYGLELLGGSPSSQASGDAVAVAARAASSRFRELAN